MNMTNHYQLPSVYSRNQSFYGKANVAEYEDGTKALWSYTTPVCYIDQRGAFHRTWHGYSATTMKHVNDFIYQNGIHGGGAAWWRSQPCEELPMDYYSTGYFIPKYRACYY